jgi:pyroglutamyl-peptidase
VAESDDAGRFICNYLYYLSLKQFKDAGRGVSLFVHVPSFETLPQEQHLAFARDLLDTITEQLCDA